MVSPTLFLSFADEFKKLAAAHAEELRFLKKDAPTPAGKLSAPFEPVEKSAAGAPTRGGFMMASDVPLFCRPSLASPLPTKKTASTAVSPTGMLTASKRIGLPKTSAPPGPSIAQVAKPVGFGRPAAGATKGV